MRDRFARLQQIAYALNTDDDENVRLMAHQSDVFALGTAVGISWQFTPAEVQTIRQLRL